MPDRTKNIQYALHLKNKMKNKERADMGLAHENTQCLLISVLSIAFSKYAYNISTHLSSYTRIFACVCVCVIWTSILYVVCCGNMRVMNCWRRGSVCWYGFFFLVKETGTQLLVPLEYISWFSAYFPFSSLQCGFHMLLFHRRFGCCCYCCYFC